MATGQKTWLDERLLYLAVFLPVLLLLLLLAVVAFEQ